MKAADAIGIAVQKARGNAGQSLRTAAEATGVSFAFICNIENGKHEPSLSTIEKMEEAWGVDLLAEIVRLRKKHEATA